MSAESKLSSLRMFADSVRNIRRRAWPAISARRSIRRPRHASHRARRKVICSRSARSSIGAWRRICADAIPCLKYSSIELIERGRLYLPILLWRNGWYKMRLTMIFDTYCFAVSTPECGSSKSWRRYPNGSIFRRAQLSFLTALFIRLRGWTLTWCRPRACRRIPRSARSSRDMRESLIDCRFVCAP